MTYIEIESHQQSGWFCHNDLILICDREEFPNVDENIFLNDQKRQIRTGVRRRYIPQVDFTDGKLFPSTRRMNIDDEIQSELNSMLACREYVSKQNHFFDRKQFQQAQAAQAEEEKKYEQFHQRQQEQSKIQRRRQHPSYVSRFDEKRYVPSMRKRLSN